MKQQTYLQHKTLLHGFIRIGTIQKKCQDPQIIANPTCLGTLSNHYIMLISSTKRNAGLPFPLCHSGMLRSDVALIFT